MLGDEDHALWHHLRQDSAWRYGWEGIGDIVFRRGHGDNGFIAISTGSSAFWD